MPYSLAGVTSRADHKHLVLEGGSADLFSPYATTSRVDYRPFTVHSDAQPFNEFTSGFKNAVVQSQTGRSLDVVTEARSSWKKPPTHSVPNSAPRHFSAEPSFFPTEEHAHGYGAGPRIMPVEGIPALRFAEPPKPESPSAKYMNGAHSGMPPRSGGFNKGNMNPVGTDVINPSPASTAVPSLTAAQAKKLNEDSSRRLTMARDYYNNPWLSSTAYFNQDAAAIKADLKPPPKDEVQASPGNQVVTAYMHENKEPVWTDNGLSHAHPRRTLPQQPSSVPMETMPPGERESGFARATETSAGLVPGSGPHTGPRPLPERLLWKNKITGTGLGPQGVDTIAHCTADMYQSMARVQMGRNALKSYAATNVAAYATRTSGYAKQVAPLIRPQHKPFGSITHDTFAPYGLGASSPLL